MARTLNLEFDFGPDLKFKGDALAELGISFSDPSLSVVDQPEKVALWGAFKAAARRKAAVLRLDHKELAATEEADIRRRTGEADASVRMAQAASGQKTTEASVSAALARYQPLVDAERASRLRVLESAKALESAVELADTLEAICYALVDRRAGIQHMAAAMYNAGDGPMIPRIPARDAQPTRRKA